MIKECARNNEGVSRNLLFRRNRFHSQYLLLILSILSAACSGSTTSNSTQTPEYLLSLVGPSTVYSGVCSVFFVNLSDVSTQSYKAASSNLTLNLSSTLGGFFTTDSTCSQSTSTITIPSGLGLGFIYYKHSEAGSTTLTLSDPLSSLAPVSKSIQINTPETAGTLDNSFDLDGKRTTPIGSGDDYASGVALQPDGKIIAVGYSYNGSDDVFALARYNSDGSLDDTFGEGGKRTTPIGSGNDYALSVALQSDGKIVAVGYSSNGSNYDFALIRVWP